MKNYCHSCFHDWNSRAKSGLSKVCPKCKRDDVHLAPWSAGATPTGPQMLVAPPSYPNAAAYPQAWAPQPPRRSSSTGLWIGLGVGGIFFVMALAFCGAVMGHAGASRSSAKAEPPVTGPEPGAPVLATTPASAIAKAQTSPAPTVKPLPSPAPTTKPAPVPSPQPVGCAGAGMSTCRDGSCGCYGRGCCSHHGGIAH